MVKYLIYFDYSDCMIVVSQNAGEAKPPGLFRTVPEWFSRYGCHNTSADIQIVAVYNSLFSSERLGNSVTCVPLMTVVTIIWMLPN